MKEIKCSVCNTFLDTNSYIELICGHIYHETCIEKYNNQCILFHTSIPFEVDIKNINYKQKLSESFIEKYKSKLDWKKISEYQCLSEKFITSNKFHVDWRIISCTQVLSEQFILHNKNYVDWTNIAIYQNISQKTLNNFSNRINQKKIDLFIEQLYFN